MPSSGIEVNAELQQKWNALRLDTNVNYIIINIENMEKFSLVTSGSSSDPTQTAQGLIQDKEPAYILIRANPEKFYIVFYVPLGSKNALKMVYSSSLNALKSGLGTDYLVSEIYITAKNELNPKSLENSTAIIDRTILMTQQEQLQQDAAYSTVGNFETEAKISADLPIKTSQAAQNAINELKSGAISTVAFTLNTTTEELEVFVKGNLTPEQVQAQMQPKTPSFIYFKYNHTNPNTSSPATIGFFIYYCPTSAPVKSKMFHSSAKAVVIKVLESNGLPKESGFEADSPTEVNTEHLMKTIYPPSQQVTRVAKPVPPHLRRKQGGSPMSPISPQ